ncbi:unnamed protein product [Gordionus sp. m RMFG-2023]
MPYFSVINHFLDYLWNHGQIRAPDFVIKLPCGNFKCHKIVLLAHSELIKEYVDSKETAEAMDFMDNKMYGYITPLSFSNIIKFMYTDTLNLGPDLDILLMICHDLKMTYMEKRMAEHFKFVTSNNSHLKFPMCKIYIDLILNRQNIKDHKSLLSDHNNIVLVDDKNNMPDNNLEAFISKYLKNMAIKIGNKKEPLSESHVKTTNIISDFQSNLSRDESTFLSSIKNLYNYSYENLYPCICNFGTGNVKAPWKLFEKQFNNSSSNLLHLYYGFDIMNRMLHKFNSETINGFNFCEACAYLSSDNLIVDTEYSVFEKAIKYLDTNNYFKDTTSLIPLIILSCVRYIYMSSQELSACYNMVKNFPLHWKLPILLVIFKNSIDKNITWPPNRFLNHEVC